MIFALETYIDHVVLNLEPVRLASVSPANISNLRVSLEGGGRICLALFQRLCG